MSDRDRTYRPPDQGDRTMIVPGSRRRRSAAPEGDQPPAGGTPAPGPGDEWAAARANPAHRRVAAAADVGAGVPVLARRQQMVVPNENPIVRAAAPLLLTLGSLRISLIDAPASALMQDVADAVIDFERDIRAAGIPDDQVRTAKYILCATADDIVQNIPGDQHVWTQYSMLSRFFGERQGGIQFFRELDRLKMDPSANYLLLELLHACLNLGFQGMHRTSAGNAAALQQIQRSLYEMLRRIRKPEPALSPHWQGKPIAPFMLRFQIPVWTVSALLGVLLFALYLAFRTLLANAADATVNLAATLHPTSEVSIQRRVFSPPPPPPPVVKSQQIVRVRQALAPDIADGKVRVQQTGDQIIVSLGNVGLFASAEAQVNPGFEPVGARISAMLDKETGPIKVTGHTDNSPLKTMRFASNYDLSLARAKAVAGVLRRGLSQPDRLRTEGRGADVPVATNDTPEGRAQNRRVDISIPRVD